MSRPLLLILGVLILYLAPALTLKLVYGQSYRVLPCANCWVADDNGGWQAKGFPDKLRPRTASENVPFFLELIPILLPLLLVALYLLSPLAQYLERQPGFGKSAYEPEKYAPNFVEAQADDKTKID